MRRIRTFIAMAVILSCLASAQQKLVDEVKISANVLTPTIDTYKKSLAALQPALTHPDTRDKVETWFLAENIAFSLCDKYNANISIGKPVKDKDRVDALLNGHNYYLKALSLDTVLLRDKKGVIKYDKKTGKPKFKAKYSKDIIKHQYQHVAEYLQLGHKEIENKSYQTSFDLLTIYTALIDVSEEKWHKISVPDSTRGLICYYKGVDLYFLERFEEAAVELEEAKRLGFSNKAVYDLIIDCYHHTKQTDRYISSVSQAYDLFHKEDDAYSRILINHYVSNKNHTAAEAYIDNSLSLSPNDDNLINLKGLVTEQKQNLDSASVFYMKAVELNAENAEAQFNLGRYYYNKAIKFKEENLMLSPKKLRAKVNPLYKQALPHFEQSYRLNPNNEALKDALMNIYYQLGDGKRLKEIESKNHK